jgi:uncharacterized repeat protein (TIGR01451 family)
MIPNLVERLGNFGQGTQIKTKRAARIRPQLEPLEERDLLAGAVFAKGLLPPPVLQAARTAGTDPAVFPGGGVEAGPVAKRRRAQRRHHHHHRVSAGLGDPGVGLTPSSDLSLFSTPSSVPPSTGTGSDLDLALLLALLGGSSGGSTPPSTPLPTTPPTTLPPSGVTQVADVAVTATADQTLVSTGTQLTFRFTVQNVGTVMANNVMLDGEISNIRLQLLSATSTAGTLDTTLEGVNGSLGRLAPGASATVTLVTRVTASPPSQKISTVSATAVVWATEDNPGPVTLRSDTYTGNNKSTVSVQAL